MGGLYGREGSGEGFTCPASLPGPPPSSGPGAMSGSDGPGGPGGLSEPGADQTGSGEGNEDTFYTLGLGRANPSLD